MTLTLQRDDCTADRTFGTLSIDGVLQCQTLEPARTDLDPLEDHPAIPPGRYRVSIRFSVKFQTLLPCVNNVPGRTNIEIHAGNVVANTAGCILVGESRLGHAIVHSRDALGDLMRRLAPDLAANKDVFIDVRNPDV